MRWRTSVRRVDVLLFLCYLILETCESHRLHDIVIDHPRKDSALRYGNDVYLNLRLPREAYVQVLALQQNASVCMRLALTVDGEHKNPKQICAAVPQALREVKSSSGSGDHIDIALNSLMLHGLEPGKHALGVAVMQMPHWNIIAVAPPHHLIVQKPVLELSIGGSNGTDAAAASSLPCDSVHLTWALHGTASELLAGSTHCIQVYAAVHGTDVAADFGCFTDTWEALLTGFCSLTAAGGATRTPSRRNNASDMGGGITQDTREILVQIALRQMQSGVELARSTAVRMRLSSPPLPSSTRTWIRRKYEPVCAGLKCVKDSERAKFYAPSLFLRSLQQSVSTMPRYLGTTTAVLNICDKNLMHLLPLWQRRLTRVSGSLGAGSAHIVVALDRETMALCEAHGKLRCVEWPQGTIANSEIFPNGTRPSVKSLGGTNIEAHISRDVRRDIGHIKFAATLALLELGRDVIFSEMDVFWLRDPLPHLLNSTLQWTREQCHWCGHMGGARPPFAPAAAADLQISGHAAHSRVNIGFYFMRATRAAISFMDQLLHLHSRRVFDQTEFDMLLGDNCDYMPCPIGSICGKSNESSVSSLLTAEVRHVQPNFPNASKWQASRLVWRKLDYNFFAGGDGIDAPDGIVRHDGTMRTGLEDLITVHTFQPMQKFALDELYTADQEEPRTNGHFSVERLQQLQSRGALPASLRTRPSPLQGASLFRYAAPGLLVLALLPPTVGRRQGLVPRVLSSSSLYNLPAGARLNIRAQLDPMVWNKLEGRAVLPLSAADLDFCLHITPIDARHKPQERGCVPAVAEDQQLLRGSAGRVVLPIMTAAPFPEGENVISMWVAWNGTNLTDIIRIRFRQQPAAAPATAPVTAPATTTVHAAAPMTSNRSASASASATSAMRAPNSVQPQQQGQLLQGQRQQHDDIQSTSMLRQGRALWWGGVQLHKSIGAGPLFALQELLLACLVQPLCRRIHGRNEQQPTAVPDSTKKTLVVVSAPSGMNVRDNMTERRDQRVASVGYFLGTALTSSALSSPSVTVMCHHKGEDGWSWWRNRSQTIPSAVQTRAMRFVHVREELGIARDDANGTFSAELRAVSRRIVVILPNVPTDVCYSRAACKAAIDDEALPLQLLMLRWARVMTAFNGITVLIISAMSSSEWNDNVLRYDYLHLIVAQFARAHNCTHTHDSDTGLEIVQHCNRL